jgi:pimeloyl-ACP methyl ester carboxylesterase
MGGTIARRLAISHPDRVLSLTSIASFARLAVLGTERIPADLLATVPTLEQYLGLWSILAGNTYPLDLPLYRELYREQVKVRKGYNPESMTRHLGAIARSPSRIAELPNIELPTLVLHGTAHPLVSLTHAREYAGLIPSARFVEMAGVGHDIPRGICPRIHPEIFTLLQRV